VTIFVGKLKWIVLLSLFVVGMGFLQIKYPHAIDGFDDNYTGRGVAGLILLLFELFLTLTWGKIGGILAIVVGVLIFLMFISLNQQQASDTSSAKNNNNRGTALKQRLLRSGFHAGKAYVQRQQNKQGED